MTPSDDYVPKPRPEPIDVSYTFGWTIDIVSQQGDVAETIYRDCSLTTLARASSLFERVARIECNKPRGYGFETKLRYVLPKGIASAAFLRILNWLYAINEITAHGEIEDPQISTFENDGLMQYLRLLQAACLLELKYPFGNQKRLPDMIKAHIKKAFDTKDSKFKYITIQDTEIGVIWDMNDGDRHESVVKLLLALFVEAMDLRKDPKNRYRFKDKILLRFEALMERNAAFKSAVMDVKTKKDVRKREEERERRGLPKAAKNHGHSRPGNAGASRGRQKKQQHHQQQVDDTKVVASPGGVWDEGWEVKELTEDQIRALMSRPEEFAVCHRRGRFGPLCADQEDGTRE